MSAVSADSRVSKVKSGNTQTDGRTETIALPPALTRSVDKSGAIRERRSVNIPGVKPSSTSVHSATHGGIVDTSAHVRETVGWQQQCLSAIAPAAAAAAAEPIVHLSSPAIDDTDHDPCDYNTVFQKTTRLVLTCTSPALWRGCGVLY